MRGIQTDLNKQQIIKKTLTNEFIENISFQIEISYQLSNFNISQPYCRHLFSQSCVTMKYLREFKLHIASRVMPEQEAASEVWSDKHRRR